MLMNQFFWIKLIVWSASPNPIKKLRADLLRTYDPVVRPVKNAIKVTNVSILVIINQIIDMVRLEKVVF